jgi:hypothetical protein
MPVARERRRAQATPDKGRANFVAEQHDQSGELLLGWLANVLILFLSTDF